MSEQPNQSRARKAQAAAVANDPISQEVHSPQTEVPVLMRKDAQTFSPDEASADVRRFTTIANICRYTGIASGVFAIFAPFVNFAFGIDGMQSILFFVAVGVSLMIIGIVYRSKAAARRSQLEVNAAAQAQEAMKVTTRSSHASPSEKAQAEVLLASYRDQIAGTKRSAIVQLVWGGALLLLPLLYSLASSGWMFNLVSPNQACTGYGCDLGNSLFNTLLGFVLVIALSVLSLVSAGLGLTLLILGAVKLNKVKNMQQTLLSADPNQSLASETIEGLKKDL